MGATVTTGKRVYAYADKAGHPVYVLCEETYEKNVYPHTPRWSVVAFGRIEDVISRLFSFAADTCGGMLQGRGGLITPTGYVAGWLQEMKAPRAFSDEQTALVVKTYAYGQSGVIYEEHASQAYATLRTHGRADLADQLARGERITLRYRDDTAVLCALAVVVPPWCLLDHFHVGLADPVSDPTLAYRPKPARTAPHISLPGLFRMRPKGDREGPENIVVSKNGRPVVGEWEYTVRAVWVRDYGQHEVSHPGHFQRLYRALVQHLDDLPLLPAETRIQVDVSQLQHDWQKKSAQEVADVIGPHGCTFGDMATDWQRFRIITAFQDAIILTLPEADGKESIKPVNQMGLFTAA